jgi:hypothetical protein
MAGSLEAWKLLLASTLGPIDCVASAWLASRSALVRGFATGIMETL